MSDLNHVHTAHVTRPDAIAQRLGTGYEASISRIRARNDQGNDQNAVTRSQSGCVCFAASGESGPGLFPRTSRSIPCWCSAGRPAAATGRSQSGWGRADYRSLTPVMASPTLFVKNITNGAPADRTAPAPYTTV